MNATRSEPMVAALSVACLLFSLCLANAFHLAAQEPTSLKWVVPETTQTVDFRADNPARRAVFLEDGMAFEVPLSFYLIKQRRLTIVAEPPEHGGRFDVTVTNPKAALRVENPRIENGQCRAELIVALPQLSAEPLQQETQNQLDSIEREAARQAELEADDKTPLQQREYLQQRKQPAPADDNRLRDQFVRQRQDDLIHADVLRRLKDLARQKDAWFTATQIKDWQQKDAARLLAEYRAVYPFEFADRSLRDIGFQLDANVVGYRNFLSAKLAAIDAVILGKTIRKEREPGDPASGETEEQRAERLQAMRAVSALNPDQLRHLRELMTATLAVRFYTHSDKKDANSQWFNAQRVRCRALGVAAIRVQGELAPASGDRVDWWQLDGYDPAKIELKVPESERFRIDPPFVSGHTARLRVTADGGPSKYWFEFRPATATTGKLKVIVNETNSLPNLKFPF